MIGNRGSFTGRIIIGDDTGSRIPVRLGQCLARFSIITAQFCPQGRAVAVPPGSIVILTVKTDLI